MYNDIYDGVNDSITSGYMCCKTTTCACNVSKDWGVSDTTYKLNGDDYLIFKTLNGFGRSVIVGSDASLCPSNGWTTAVNNIIDPNTGLSGFGCKLTSIGLTYLNVLIELYTDRAISGEGCGFIFTPAGPKPLPPPLGTIISQSCDGTTRVIVTADGNGGSTTTRTDNSPLCGYIPPIPPQESCGLSGYSYNIS
jgi:hypothetical protein